MMDIIEYFTKITGFTPIPQQIDMLHRLVDLAIKNQCLSAGRGFSKTLCCAIVALWFADVYSDSIGKSLNILLISSQKRLYWHLNNFFANPELKAKLAHEGWVYNIPTERCELKNGSIIYPLMDTSKSIRGYRADIIFIDEAADIKTEIIKAAMGCFTGTINKVVFLSTPHKSGYFTDKLQDPPKGWEILMYSSRDAPWQNGMVERLEADDSITDADKAMEIDGRPPTKVERSFFNLKQLEEKCMVDRESIREGGEKSQVEFGIDPAGEVFALVMSEKMGSRRNILDVIYWKLKPMQEVADEIQKYVKVYTPMIIKMDSKPEDYKQYFRSRFPSIKFIDAALGNNIIDDKGQTIWNNHKEQMLGQLHRRIQTGSIEIPRKFVELIIQLRKYKRGMNRGDDLVDALALSCYEPLINTGETHVITGFKDSNSKGRKKYPWSR